MVTPVATDLLGLEPLIEVARPVILKLSIFFGGIVGLCIILILIRVHYERKKIKLLQDIRYNLDKLNIHYGLTNSRSRKDFLERVWNKIRGK